MVNNFLNKYKHKINFLKQYSTVVDWNAIAGDGTHDLSDKKFETQVGFVVEEYKELLDAFKSNNDVEVYDALGDLFVVLSYLYYLDSTRSGLVIDTDDFISVASVKPFAFFDWMMLSPEEVRSLLLDPVELEMGIIYEELTKLMTTIVALYKGEEVVNEVLRSNMTKYLVYDIDDTNIADTCLYECSAIEARGRYTNITSKLCTVNGTTYVVFVDGNGKIMKPTTMQNPNIEAIIKKAN